MKEGSVDQLQSRSKKASCFFLRSCLEQRIIRWGDLSLLMAIRNAKKVEHDIGGAAQHDEENRNYDESRGHKNSLVLDPIVELQYKGKSDTASKAGMPKNKCPFGGNDGWLRNADTDKLAYQATHCS
eukprot:gnl/TRDRNA2_/TRDRNA2_160812_c0_seq1.p3 gnl/TRDRNA2_/TRDRNA2_160812_c0~~gnl/TRDRNA2_/TRDRNA2_160812_c0_seq1.p3  ORF type:complete len:127 (-),score=22.45 gnl/TRDRNA2_/TRDRNA2_160812_c0_seq1:134-514(-)